MSWNRKGAVSTATACRWFNSFRNKDYSLEDDQRSGRPTEIDLSELKQIIESDPNLSQRDVAAKVGCTQQAIQYQFKKLGLVSKLGQWAPHDLTVDQKKNVSRGPTNFTSCTGITSGLII
jgi:transposase